MTGRDFRKLLFVRAPEAAAQGLRQLSAYRLRTALALSGIVVGVAALVGSLALLDGVERMVLTQFEAWGGARAGRVAANNGTFRFGRWNSLQKVHQLTVAETEALRSLPVIETASVANISFAVECRTPTATLSGLGIWGVGVNFRDIRPLALKAGRFFDETEAREAAPVVVLFERLASDLFGEADPIGREVLMNGSRFTVIGIGRFPGGRPRWGYVPLEAKRRRIDGHDDLVIAYFKLRKGVPFPQAKPEILQFLAARHPGAKPDDFSAYSVGERQDKQLRTVRTQGKILISIAVLCLLAGGIGILNVFLIAATERTREIGVRIALGATRRGVLSQFLFEAVLLCTVGGAIGVGLAAGIAELFASIVRKRMDRGSVGMNELSVSIGPAGIALGFALAIVAAVVFGTYPAVRASRVDPATSLRSE